MTILSHPVRLYSVIGILAHGLQSGTGYESRSGFPHAFSAGIYRAQYSAWQRYIYPFDMVIELGDVNIHDAPDSPCIFWICLMDFERLQSRKWGIV